MSVIATFKHQDGTIYVGADGICADACNVRTVSAYPKVVKKMIGPAEDEAPMLIGCVGNYRILNVIAELSLPWSQARSVYHYINGVLVPKLRDKLEDEPWAQMEHDKEWGITVIYNGRVFEINHTNYEVMEPALPYTANGAAMEAMMGALAIQHRMGVHAASAILEGLYICDLHHIHATPPFYVYTVRPDTKNVDCTIYGAETVGMEGYPFKKFWD